MNMKKKNVIAALMAGVMLLGTLTGCGSEEKPAASAAPTEQAQVVETAPAADQPRTITDQGGHVVELPDQVNSVYGTIAAIDAITVMLGAGDKLIATSNRNKNSPWMARMVPGIKELPTPSIDIKAGNLEELMELNPDVVVCYNEACYDSVTNTGLTAVQVNTSNMKSIQDYIILLGEILGGEYEAKAHRLLEYYLDNVDRVQERTQSIPDAERPRVFFSCGSMISTEGADSIVTEWIDVAGGVNVAAEHGVDGDADITPEELMEWDPDVIICTNPEQKDEYKNDPTLSNLSAVRNDKVFVNPDGVFLWCVRSADEAIQPIWAATVIHPELFGDIDMVEECKYFHREFYGMELTDEDVQSILFPTRD